MDTSLDFYYSNNIIHRNLNPYLILINDRPKSNNNDINNSKINNSRNSNNFNSDIIVKIEDFEIISKDRYFNVCKIIL